MGRSGMVEWWSNGAMGEIRITITIKIKIGEMG